MHSLSIYAGSFCEIKTAYSSKTVCTGYIKQASDDSIVLTNTVFFASDRAFDAVISILSQSRGMQVFRTTILSMEVDGTVLFANFEKVTDVERRAAFRAVVDLPALVTVDSDPSTGYDAIIKDMSVKGVAVWIQKPLSLDGVIHVQFPIEHKGQVVCNCQCVVVRNIGNNFHNLKKYGCDFVKMSDESRAAIQAYMTKKRTELMRQMIT